LAETVMTEARTRVKRVEDFIATEARLRRSVGVREAEAGGRTDATFNCLCTFNR
jgi:hypothetical protein